MCAVCAYRVIRDRDLVPGCAAMEGRGPLSCVPGVGSWCQSSFHGHKRPQRTHPGGPDNSPCLACFACWWCVQYGGLVDSQAHAYVAARCQNMAASSLDGGTSNCHPSATGGRRPDIRPSLGGWSGVQVNEPVARPLPTEKLTFVYASRVSFG